MGGVYEISNKRKEELKKLLMRMFENVGNRAEYFVDKVCRKCERHFVCFPQGFMFEMKEIEACERIPEIVKIWYQAKAMGMMESDYPLKIDFKKLRC